MPEDRRTRLMGWLASGEASLHPLAFPQRELWETSPVPPEDVSNHLFALVNFRGVISAMDCEAAVQRIVDRHEVLRLSFLPGKDRPVQMIRSTSRANFQFRELSSAEGRPDALEGLAQEIFYEPFDLLQGPLYRVRVLRRAIDEHVMVLAIHHAIADGWSLGLFIQDLSDAYLQGLIDADGKLPPVSLSYTAWGAAERAFWRPEEIAARAEFWKSRLAGSRRLWNTNAVSGLPQRLVLPLPANLGRAARELARRSGGTLFNTLLAAFQIALSQWTEVNDIVVGTPVANRATQAVRETMGYCAGTVPLRAHINRDQPFLDALHEVNRATVDCFANAMPFAELTRALGEPQAPGRNPVFEVRFALQNYPVPEIDLPGFSARLRVSSSGNPRYALGCELTERGDVLEVGWLYRPGMFSHQDIREINGLFQSVLTGACRSPESRIAALATSSQ